MTEPINNILKELDINPILVDIGSSGKPPGIWDKIAKHSIYVGFDPDLRESHELPEGRFFKRTIVNEAITTRNEENEALFYFTKSPYCSSVLKPDAKSLSNFIFSDLFTVEKEERVHVSTLDLVMGRLSLSSIDWLKVDSQGMDLRIFNSLKNEVRSKVLAIDIEPGLIDAYLGEDLFVDAHRDLVKNGFWLSNLNVCGTVRMRKSTTNAIISIDKNIDQGLIEKTLKKSPCWCEARYFRTLEWLASSGCTKREYILLWIFSLLDNQIGFALDLAYEYEKIFVPDDISKIMKSESTTRIMHYIQRLMQRRLVTNIKMIVPAPLKHWLKKFVFSKGALISAITMQIIHQSVLFWGGSQKFLCGKS